MASMGLRMRRVSRERRGGRRLVQVIRWGVGLSGGVRGKVWCFGRGMGLGLVCITLFLLVLSRKKGQLIELCIEPSITISRRRVYPAVGLKSEGAVVRANFGGKTFRYIAGGDGKMMSGQMDGFEMLQIADAGEV